MQRLHGIVPLLLQLSMNQQHEENFSHIAKNQRVFLNGAVNYIGVFLAEAVTAMPFLIWRIFWGCNCMHFLLAHTEGILQS
jgi:hypothetical protein